MTPTQVLHKARLSEWTARFQEQSKSGLTVKDWCAQNQLSIHSYHYWKRQLKSAYLDAMPDIVPLLPQPLPPAPAVSVSSNFSNSYNSAKLSNPPVSDASASDLVSLHTPDFCIQIRASASDESVLRLLKAVRHA